MSEAKQREVLQLLRDYRSWETAFGGARPMDEQHVVDASYGPAGLITRGAAFVGADITKSDRIALGRSMGHLRLALHVLRGEDFNAWASLIEFYLGDPADPGMVEDYRRKVQELDAENAAIRKENERRRKKGRPAKDEKVRLVFARLQLERHDRAIEKLACYLRRTRLHPIHPRLMSGREEAAGDAANAQLVAYFQRVLNEQGRTHRGAIQQTAWKFERLEEDVERVIEHREHLRLATCAEEGCTSTVFSQNLCQKHYKREWRAANKNEKAS